MAMTESPPSKIPPDEAELRFRTLIERPIVGMLVRRFDTLLFANQAFAELLGYDDPQEVIGLGTVDAWLAPGEKKRIREFADARLRGENPLSHYEFEALRKDGQPVWLENRSVKIDWGGDTAILGAFNDVTDRRVAEARLKESEQWIKDFADSASDWFWETDTEHRFTRFSGLSTALVAHWTKVSIGHTRFELRLPEDTDDAEWAAHQADLDSRRPFREFRCLVRRWDGAIRNARINGQPVWSADDKFLGYRGAGNDITEIVEAEQRARSTEVLLYSVIDNLSESFLLCDADDRLIFGNKAWQSVTAAIPPDSLIGSRFEDFVRFSVDAGLLPQAQGNEQGWIEDRLARHRVPRGPFEVQRADGRYLVVRDHKLADGGTATIATDVTELKRAELALRDNQASAADALLRDAVESLSEGFALLDADDRLVLMNERYLELYKDVAHLHVPGAHFDDMVRGVAESGLIGEAVGREEEWIQDRIARHKNPGPRFERRLGPNLWLMASDQRTRDGGSVSVVTDITDLKCAEQELRKLSSAVEQSRSVIIITGIDGRIDYVNPMFTEVTGYAAAEAIGKTPAMLKSGTTPTAHYQELRQSLTSGREWRGDIQNRRKNGEFYWCREIISPIHDDNGEITHFLAVEEDVTEHRRIEAQLRQSQKMEAIGQLAGGIAHDFNNILQIISGFVELASREQPLESPSRGYLETANRSVERARDLVQKILTFSRRVVSEKVEVNPASLLTEIVALMRATLPSTIEIEPRLDRTTGMVLADPTQIEQVVVNLCNNGAQAMTETGGRLSVSLEEAEVGNNFVVVSGTLKPGRYMTIAVEDTGGGISEAVQKRMFEPFFTTKDIGEGSGLGLAMVHGIVAAHDGGITVRSSPARGTRFTVYLPRFEEIEILPVAVDEERNLSGSERILFVDDEPAATELAGYLLSAQGYEVESHTSSLAALEAFRDHPQEFDLVITDQTMPGMTGDLLAREMLKIRADIPIVLCTGYSQRINEHSAKSIGVREFVMKPLVANELLKVVRRALDGE